MTFRAPRTLQPAPRRLEVFSFHPMRLLCALAVAGNLASALVAPAFASDITPKPTTTIDLTKLGEIEIVAGIKVSDLGEFAPLAIELLARGVPLLGVLKDILKAASDVKDKFETKAHRAEDAARLQAAMALLTKVAAAIAEESERQAARFRTLVADNRTTHEALTRARHQLDELKRLLQVAGAHNAAMAATLKKMQPRFVTTPHRAPKDDEQDQNRTSRPTLREKPLWAVSAEGAQRNP